MYDDRMGENFEPQVKQDSGKPRIPMYQFGCQNWSSKSGFSHLDLSSKLQTIIETMWWLEFMENIFFSAV